MVATVIASQGLISGAFSLASQAIALGLFPRLRIVHTHHARAGQILRVLHQLGAVRRMRRARDCVSVQFSARLRVRTRGIRRYGGDVGRGGAALLEVELESGLLFGALAAIDASFLLANSLKFLEGGFVPLAVGIVIFLVMVTWRWGRKATFAAYSAKHTMTMAELVRLKRRSEVIIDRNAVLTFPSRCAQSMTTPPRCCSFFGSARERCPGTSFSSRSCIARCPITTTTATT
jgi:KUP system potassium uptake protein